jgi:hypothetical protein
MILLPRVSALTRERIARELDSTGPGAIGVETAIRLKDENPELLDMAGRCARDVDDAKKAMVGFGAFYWSLTLEARSAVQHPALAALPRVSSRSRDMLVSEINDKGPERFAADAIDHMEEHNPELLQMAHNFSSRHAAYPQIMQGFCLIYKALVIQSTADRHRPH